MRRVHLAEIGFNTMRVECPHAQVRRVHKLAVRTPLVAPSFSSRGFPYVSDIWEEFRHKLFGVCLVSAYDVAAGRIPTDVAEMVNVVIVDSGLYETNKGWNDSGDLYTPSSAPDWTREQYHEAVKSIDERGNTVLVNFDQVGTLEDQIARALEDFSLATCAASDFLVKPADETEWVNIPKLSRQLEELKQFNVIGIAAREAGDSFLKRCSSIVMLRDLLNDVGLETPIHVFGAINPYEVLAYFFCGADIFDGLNWLRLAFRNSGSAPIDETATEDMKWNLMEWDLQTVQCTYNLTLLFRLQEAMREYAASGALESLVEEFPLARQAARIAEIAGAEIRN